MRKSISVIILALFFVSGFGQQAAKDAAFNNITVPVIQGQLEFLASDWTEGRNTGEKGAYLAADYIASMFKAFGLKPGGDYVASRRQNSRSRSARPSRPSRGYFQNFNLLESSPGDEQKCAIIETFDGGFNAIHLNYGIDFTVSPGVQAISVESPLVFVGYGFKGDGYNDFEGIDVKGKIIIRLAGYPGHRNPDSKAAKKYAGDGPYARYMVERNKNTTALAEGAAAVINLTGGYGLRGTPANIPFRYSDSRTGYEGNEPFRSGVRKRLTRTDQDGQGITQITLSKKSLDRLLQHIDLDIEAFETQAEKKMKPESRTLDSKKLRIETSVETRLIQVRNVVGIIEGKNPESCLVIGAHYDHMGMTRNFIYNGSDDNASGTVGVMTIAKAMMETGEQPDQTLVFCAWTGEEKGLIGSAYYADHPLIPDIKCYLNYDMISRVALDDPNKNKCDFQYTSTVPILKELTVKHIEGYKVNLDMAYKGSEMPVGGSDFSSFSRKGIPIFLLHGKFTPDYHAHTDHSDKAEWTYMRDIIRVGFLNIYELAKHNW